MPNTGVLVSVDRPWVWGVLMDLCFHFSLPHIDLIALHSTLKGFRIALRIKQADFLQHVPCACLGDVEVTAQLMGGNTLLMAADKVHGHEPLDKRQLGILEDCANET